jgi:excisionase family DNA binding protein
MSDSLLTARQVADPLGLSVETVLRWHRSGKLPGGRRLGSNVLRFDGDELEQWLDGTRELEPVTQRSYDRGHA